MSSAMRMGRQRIGDLESLRGSWLCLVAMGITLIVIGLIAIGSSFIATMATLTVFGILLLVGAVTQLITAILGRQWRGFFIHLLAAVLYFVAGLFLLDHPVVAALSLTLMIAAYLWVGGIVHIVLALVERFPGWGWALLNGVVSLVLGISIWRQWPLSGLEVIGLFVGIEMVFSGFSWLMLGFGVHSIPKSATHS